MIFIYVTCKNKQQAMVIGRKLMEKRLVACINAINNMASLSLWPPKTGKIEEANEAILIGKTLESKYEAVEQEILRLHTYKNPFIGAIPIVKVSKKYLSWLVGELK